MHFHPLAVLAAGTWLIPIATARLSCVVKGLGGGQDDGPNILAAFQRCKNNGRVTLADYYSVDTLLMTTGLNDVEVELSGTRECSMCRVRFELL
jgi:galacturan 1,4-alpha-galacturonidase